MPRVLTGFPALQGLLRPIGLAYTKDAFDHERFTAIQGIAEGLMASLANSSVESIRNIHRPEKGCATPKIDVRAVIFQDDKILLVQERADCRWTLPGGWADVNCSPSMCVEREVYEEAGLRVKVVKLLACLDKAKQGHPPELFHTWKLFFHCDLQGGTPSNGFYLRLRQHLT